MIPSVPTSRSERGATGPANKDLPGTPVFLPTTRWTVLLVALSLDSVRPFWGSMGFELGGGAEAERALVEVLRRAVFARVPRERAARRVGQRAGSSLVEAVLPEVTRRLGEHASHALLRFGRFLFTEAPADHPELYAWHDVLARCSEAAEIDRLAPWSDVASALIEARARAHARVVHERLPADLGPWDKLALRLRKVRSGDLDAHEHPMRLVTATSRTASERRFWREALPLFDADRREALQWNATRLAWSHGLVPREDTLPDPITLVEETR